MDLHKLITALMDALPARRGNLYEQYFDRKGADGKTRRYGPYYVWTRCEDGQMISERVAREDVPRVRAEIAQGKKLDVLIAQIWKLAEKMCRDAGDKKKRHRTNRWGGGRPHCPDREYLHGGGDGNLRPARRRNAPPKRSA